MAIYKNITRGNTTTLIASQDRHGSSISKMSIANKSNSHKATIDIYLDDGTEQFHFLKHGQVDEGSALILVDCLAFDRNRFSLKISETGNQADISVIII